MYWRIYLASLPQPYSCSTLSNTLQLPQIAITTCNTLRHYYIAYLNCYNVNSSSQFH